MKQIKMILSALVLSAIFLTSCTNGDNVNTQTPVATETAIAAESSKKEEKSLIPQDFSDVDSKILNATVEPGLGFDIRLVGAYKKGTNPVFSWAIQRVDESWFEFDNRATTTFGPGKGSFNFKFTVKTDENPTGTSIVKTYVRDDKENEVIKKAVADEISRISCPSKIETFKMTTPEENPALGENSELTVSTNRINERSYSWELLGEDNLWKVISSNKTIKVAMTPGVIYTFRVTVVTDECSKEGGYVRTIKSFFRTKK